MTARNHLIYAVAIKVAEKDFHAWLYAQGKSNEAMDQKTKDLRDTLGNENANLVWEPMPSEPFEYEWNGIVEGVALGNAYMKQYYMNMPETNRAWVMLVNAIKKESIARLQIYIDAWERSQTLLESPCEPPPIQDCNGVTIEPGMIVKGENIWNTDVNLYCVVSVEHGIIPRCYTTSPDTHHKSFYFEYPECWLEVQEIGCEEPTCKLRAITKKHRTYWTREFAELFGCSLATATTLNAYGWSLYEIRKFSKEDAIARMTQWFRTNRVGEDVYLKPKFAAHVWEVLQS
jgi:hypothetical protein